MKRKILLLCIAVSAVFAACDMTWIDDPSLLSGRPGSGEMSRQERDEMERTGSFLKLTNMPRNTQVPNVFSVQIANAASVIGKLSKDNPVRIFRDNDSSTVYLPLVYNDDSEFIETGFFYSAFTIHVDAVTKYIVSVSDNFLVYFTDGRGEADARSLPAKAFQNSDGPRYLTIYNLPANLSAHNISSVLVHNQAGAVAKCSDYSRIEISADGWSASAAIPLHYNSMDSVFTETGWYYVSFDINVDAELRYRFTVEDRVQVSFIDGSGFLDILNIPEKPVPCLTVSGLPFYASKEHFTDVAVYNLAGAVASCRDYNSIAVVREGQYAAALIPLSSSSGAGWFSGSGPFAVTFTINVDIETQISITRDLNLTLHFSNGSAAFDCLTFYGYFSAELTESAVPTIKAGSSFDIDGYRHTVPNNLTVSALTPYGSCVLYLYAYRVNNNVYYEYSAAAPSYVNLKRGWYNGSKRALWKMIFLRENNQFLFKTSMADDFRHFDSFVLNAADYNQLTASRPAYYALDGADNPNAAAVTLQPGVYAIRISGAGGGGGYGASSGSTVTGSSSGGDGGSVSELLVIGRDTAFTAYTGSGGYAAPAPSLSGSFTIRTFEVVISATYRNSNSGPPSPWSEWTFTPNYRLNSLRTQASLPAASGGGGGGGGSGTFLYCEEEKYFLFAGGGGGGSGGTFLTPGGAGGSGGVIGPGAGGGAAGWFQQSSNMTASEGHGGNGGGVTGGSGGQSIDRNSNRNGADAGEIQFSSRTFSNALFSGAGGTASYSSIPLNMPTISLYHYEFSYDGESHDLYLDIRPPIPMFRLADSYLFSGNSGNGGAAAAALYYADALEWLNTNNANGAGAAPSSLSPLSYSWPFPEYGFYNFSFSLGAAKEGIGGSPGGNSRNSARGGGSPGGAVSGGRPSDGSAGSVTVHKIY